MSLFVVTEKASGSEVTRYAANAITEAFDGKNYPLTMNFMVKLG